MPLASGNGQCSEQDRLLSRVDAALEVEASGRVLSSRCCASAMMRWALLAVALASAHAYSVPALGLDLPREVGAV